MNKTQILAQQQYIYIYIYIIKVELFRYVIIHIFI